MNIINSNVNLEAWKVIWLVNLISLMYFACRFIFIFVNILFAMLKFIGNKISNADNSENQM